MNQSYFTSDFLVDSRRYNLLDKLPLVIQVLTQSSSFYHYHLSSSEFIENYLASNGEVFGSQELEEFKDFYDSLCKQSERLSPDFSLVLNPQCPLEQPEYFMAQVFYRYPLKEWVRQLVWLIDQYKRYQEIKVNLENYPESFLHQLFFEWKIEEEFDRLEPVLRFFRLSCLYV